MRHPFGVVFEVESTTSTKEHVATSSEEGLTEPGELCRWGREGRVCGSPTEVDEVRSIVIEALCEKYCCFYANFLICVVKDIAIAGTNQDITP